MQTQRRQLDACLQKIAVLEQALADATPAPASVLAAAGVLGDPALVPWLIAQTQLPAARPVALDAIWRISGIDLTNLMDPRKPPPLPDTFADPSAAAPTVFENPALDWWRNIP